MYVFQLDISFQKSYCGAASFSFHFEKGKIKNWNKKLLIEKNYDFTKKKNTKNRKTRLQKNKFTRMEGHVYKL